MIGSLDEPMMMQYLNAYVWSLRPHGPSSTDSSDFYVSPEPSHGSAFAGGEPSSIVGTGNQTKILFSLVKKKFANLSHQIHKH